MTTRMRTTAVWAVLATAAVVVAGCGDTETAGAPVAVPFPTATASPPQSSGAGWITGSITRGGSGPCFGLKADDGTAYAMHSLDARTLEPGDRVKVQVVPSRLRISCGDGTQVQLQDLETLN
jgi:hypothetical protein